LQAAALEEKEEMQTIPQQEMGAEASPMMELSNSLVEVEILVGMEELQ
jgi:hypothetical protein